MKIAVMMGVAMLVSSSTYAEDDGANLLRNGGAEAGKGSLPSIWFAAMGAESVPGLRMTRSTTDPHSGQATLAIAFDGESRPPMSFNWAQAIDEVPVGKEIRLSAWIRTKDADFANVCVQCWSLKEGMETMVGFVSTPVVRGDQAWERFRTEPLVVPKDTTRILVRAALTGSGEAAFDDIAVTLTKPSPVAVTEKPQQKPVVAMDHLIRGEMEEFVEGQHPVVTVAPCYAAGYRTEFVSEALAKAAPGRVIGALPVEKDVMILSYLPTWDHGEVDTFGISTGIGACRALVGLPDPPRALLKDPGVAFYLALYARKAESTGKPAMVVAESISQDWSEQTSWQKQPTRDVDVLGTFPYVAEAGWKLFEVTKALKSRTNGAKLGVSLRFEPEVMQGGERWGYDFASREVSGEKNEIRPVLLVVEKPEGGAFGLKEAVQAAHPGGRIVRNLPMSKDAIALAYLPQLAIGGADNLGLGNANGGYRTLFSWPAIPRDLLAPPERRFLAAFYTRKVTGEKPGSIVSHLPTSHWDEAKLSWNTQPTYAPEPVGKFMVNGEPGWKLFNVTESVRASAASGLYGRGLMLRFEATDATGDDAFQFFWASREATGEDLGHRPALIAVDPK